MELLFVKCEQASQTSDCPSSDSFDVDIQTFVQRQEKERKPFFSEDTELDNLVGESFQDFTLCADLLWELFPLFSYLQVCSVPVSALL